MSEDQPKPIIMNVITVQLTILKLEGTHIVLKRSKFSAYNFLSSSIFIPFNASICQRELIRQYDKSHFNIVKIVTIFFNWKWFL